jgi:hypothetical protein
MPLSKLQFRPGFVKDATDYANEGGWFSGDKVRFRLGFPEKIGGWQKLSSKSFLGICRRLIAWTDLSGQRNFGVGTNLKYYVNRGGAYFDITPVRTTTAAGDVTFSAINGSATITVTDTAHGALADDFVIFSGATGLGGNITADVLNQEYKIDTIIDPNNYTITARTANTSITSITVDGELSFTPVTANSSDTGDGGTSTVGTYLLNRTLDTTVLGVGWGAGPWSDGAWSEDASIPITATQIALWSHDTFGEDLLINQRGGPIYLWDTSVGPSSRAVNISTLAGASDTPAQVNQVMVSDRDRHVIAFGATPQGGSELDPMLIRFSNQEDPANWTATATNTAGDLVLGSGSEIVRAVETRQQTIVLTDKAVYSLQFLGPPFTFGVTLLSQNISIISPTAATAVDDLVVWMGEEEFFVYDGTVKPLPCPVRDFVFQTMDRSEPFKVISGSNTAFGEIWWFYPTPDTGDDEAYVVYNYQQNIWYTGSLERTAWVDRARKQLPLAASRDGYLYFHESGLDDGSTNPPSAINAVIESSPIDIQDGNEFSFITRIVPDVDFRTSTSPDTNVEMTVTAFNYPGQGPLNGDGGEVIRSASAPVDLYTDKLDVRLRGRAFSLKVESDDTGVAWRLGAPRVDVKPDGRR